MVLTNDTKKSISKKKSQIMDPNEFTSNMQKDLCTNLTKEYATCDMLLDDIIDNGGKSVNKNEDKKIMEKTMAHLEEKRTYDDLSYMLTNHLAAERYRRQNIEESRNCDLCNLCVCRK
tara:strand:+ start:546 stop:899 length:354 start_codon:yes stop_codon:yes gene_type:complete